MSKRTQLVLLFLSLFIFRTFFGLSKLFYGTTDIDRDALQTYLIGLKSYTTGTWPFFGPDQYELNTGFQFQISGALEGLMVGLPFHFLKIPEAPFLFLNLLSLSALALLSWYASRKFSHLSFLFIFVWVSLLPWTLNESTHVFNVSYLLFGSILFFIGFFELIPEISLKWLSPAWAFGLMGFGFFWDMQFHQSWVLLMPFIVGAFLWRRKSALKNWGMELAGFLMGSAIPLVCLIPTLIQYGGVQSSSGLSHAAGFNFGNLKNGLTILARYLSLACFEMPRWIGTSTAERKEFLLEAPWLIPPAVFLILVGWVQPFVLLAGGWLKEAKPSRRLWVLQGLTFAGFGWIWFCFCFASKEPAAHMYYVLLPLVLFYSMAVWDLLAPLVWARKFAFVCLIASLWFQTGSAVKHIQQGSLYQNRDRIVRALDQKDYRILWERRPWALY